MKNKILSNFFEVINNNALNDKDLPARYYSYNIQNITKYIESLSNLDRKTLLSSKYWNRYPKYIWLSASYNSNRGFYKVLYAVIDEVNLNRRIYKNTYNDLIKYSEGLLLNLCLDIITGTNKMVLAKRAVNSIDERTRRAAIYMLPVKSIEKYANDKSYKIRKIVSNRVSVFAKPELFINCRDSRTRAKAISSSNLEKEYIYRHLENKALSRLPDASLIEVKSLLDQLSNEDLIYVLDISKNYKSMEKYIEKRLSAR